MILRPPASVLCEFNGFDGDIKLGPIISKLNPSTSEWKSYAYDQYGFHIISDQDTNLCFLCMAEKDMGRRIPFAFLQELVEAFKKRHQPSLVRMATDPNLSTDYQGFKDEIQTTMVRCNSPSSDRITGMMKKVEHINDKLMESMDKLLDRQEKIEVLIQQSENLATTSQTFRREATTLQRVMWWRNMRVVIGLSIGALVLLVILILIWRS
jgi:vesicle-associated membrane protein 7